MGDSSIDEVVDYSMYEFHIARGTAIHLDLRAITRWVAVRSGDNRLLLLTTATGFSNNESHHFDRDIFSANNMGLRHPSRSIIWYLKLTKLGQ